MQLTKHFSLSEFTNSQTAQRKGVDNTPTQNALFNLKLLAQTMEVIRAELDATIVISSGYRCERLNSLVGGSASSAHVDGLACDFTATAFGDPFEVAHKISVLPIKFDQLILEFYNRNTGDGWVHIGIGGKSRQQVLTINRDGTFSGILTSSPP